MKLRLSQELVQVHQNPVHVDDQYSRERNPFWSWSNHPVTSFRLEINVRGFSERQNKSSDADRYQWFFVSLKSMWQLWRNNFEQRSEFKVTKGLIVHLLSSSYNIYSLQLWKKCKAKQQWGLRVASHILLNQVRVYHERVYADNVVSKFPFSGSFSSQHHIKIIANITSEKWTKSVLENADHIIHLQGKTQPYAKFDTLHL